MKNQKSVFETVSELIAWNSTCGLCQMWQEKNPMIVYGVNFSVAESFKLESILQHEYEMLRMKHHKFGLKVALGVISIIILGFYIGGWYSLLGVASSYVIGHVWVICMKKEQLDAREEVQKYTLRNYTFIKYVVEMSRALKMEVRHLFGISSKELGNIVNKSLKELAQQIVEHQNANDTTAEEEDRTWLRYWHDLFLSGGIVESNSYAKYFMEALSSTDRN